MKVLGIETSCDETAAAVVEDATVVLSNIVSSQIDLHARYGGVVPEIASRAHLELLNSVIAEALVTANVTEDDIDVVAVTHGPGLIGALLVGVSAGKALAHSWNKPYVGVNHMEGHLYASMLEEPDLEYPNVVCLVSGGHTMLVLMEGPGRYRILGETLDDAAGEAYDKVARVLGLSYPGGPVIDKLAADGNPEAIAFPRAMLNDGYKFSFSGLKTSVINYVRKNPDYDINDVAASFQEAVVDVLMRKALAAAQEYDAKAIAIGGGVAANSLLRARVVEVCEANGLHAFVPARSMCTDNAAMIAAAGWHRFHSDGATELVTGVRPDLRLPVIA